MRTSDFVIINGFDRSGTSAIVRTLAAHPQSELIMQPFNSGFLRQLMYQIPAEKNFSTEAVIFFDALSNNVLLDSMINSHWHADYSSTKVYIPSKIHLVKTTLNHFLQDWMNVNFPEIHVWGIWRNPHEIVRSILVNGFYGQWYEDALSQILSSVRKEDVLFNVFKQNIHDLSTDVRKVAFMVAVRSYYFFYYLPKGRVLDYHQFCADANYLNTFFRYYDLNEINLRINSSVDLNIIGSQLPKKNELLQYTKEDAAFVNVLFQPLFEIMDTNHQIS